MQEHAHPHPVGSRLEAADALKGIGILCVAGIHFLGMLTTPASDPRTTSISVLLVGVPLFVAISVFFGAQELASGRGSTAITRRLTRLLVPYVAWSLGYILLAFALEGGAAAVLSKPLREIVFFGGAAGHLYFLPMLAQVLVLLPLLVVWVRAPWRATAAVLLGSAALLLSLGAGGSRLLAEAFANHWAITFLPAAAAGTAIALGTLRIRRPRLWIVGGLVAVVVQAVLIHLLGLGGGSVPYGKVGLPIATAGLMTAGLAWVRPPRALIEVGRHSFGIYLAHIAVLRLVREAVGSHSFTVVGLLAIPGTLAVVLVCLVLVRGLAATPLHTLVDGRLPRRRRLPIGTGR